MGLVAGLEGFLPIGWPPSAEPWAAYYLKDSPNTAASARKKPQAENTGAELTACFTTACDNSPDDTNRLDLCLIPPRGVEPLSPG